MKLEDFFRPVSELTDRELVEQFEILKRVRERKRRRATADPGRRDRPEASGESRQAGRADRVSRFVVIVPDRGVIRWSADGVRKVIPFPSANGRAFFDAIDGVLLAAGPGLTPAEQAALLVERIPGAERRGAGWCDSVCDRQL